MPPVPPPDRDQPGERFRRLRRLVHRQLIDSIDTDSASLLEDRDSVREQVRWLIEEIQQSRGAEISAEERRRVEEEILEELGGLGPLAPLMADPQISDILVNGPREVWVDRFGRLERTNVSFDDEAHLRRLLDRLVAGQGRHLDASSPFVDARLNDGSRLHAVIPPLCAKGPVLSIRRFRINPFTPEELVEAGCLSEPMLRFLRLAVTARVNLIVSGGAASGKTTLLNMLSRFIPEQERVVTVEETAELRLEHPHVVPLEARPANAEGRGEVGLRDLVRTALRMRADRIIVGEVRGPEVFDMLQAMNVGHDGSLTTVHANSPEDVVRRLEGLVMMGSQEMPRDAIRDLIGSAIQLIVHLTRFRDGSRRVVSLRELVPDGDGISTRELFRFRLDRVDGEGRVLGVHEQIAGSVRVLKQLRHSGYAVDGMDTGLEPEPPVEGA